MIVVMYLDDETDSLIAANITNDKKKIVDLFSYFLKRSFYRGISVKRK